MPIDAHITDGTGSRRKALVTVDNALKVSNVEISTSNQTIEDLTLKKQYRDFLRRPSDGTFEMDVDGSTTPVLFEETAEANKVKWLTSWRIILNSTNMEMDTNDFRRFGTAAIAPGLTNGIEFYFVQSGVRVDIFLLPVQKIGDFLDYADDYENLVNAVTSQSDYLHFDFDFDQPLVLPAGSNDKVVLEVHDDLTSIELMRVVIRGWQEFI